MRLASVASEISPSGGEVAGRRGPGARAEARGAEDGRHQEALRHPTFQCAARGEEAAEPLGDALAHLFRERIQRRPEERGPLAARAQGGGGEDRVFELRHGGERPAAAPRPLWMRQRHPLGLGDHAVRPQLAGGGLGSPQRIVVAALRRRGHHAHLAQDAPVDELERGERGRGVERSDDLPVLPVEAG